MPNEFVARNGVVSQNNSVISGSLTVTTGSGVELLVTSTGVSMGNALTDTHSITGSINLTGSLNLSQYSQTGSVLFTGLNGLVTQSNSDFFWDNTNKRLGISTITPISKIETYSTSLYIGGAFSMYSNTDTDESLFYFRRGRGTLVSPLGVNVGDVLGSLRFAAQVNSTIGNFNTNAKIDAVVVTNGAALRFFTNNAGLGISPTQAMQIFGSGNLLVQSGGTFTDAGYRLDVSGSFRTFGNITTTSGSSYFVVSHSLAQPSQTGSQITNVNITPTFTFAAPNQTQTALRVNATFTGSSNLTSSQANIIADFGSTSAGSQFLVNDVTSGSIYMVNDVSGIPIIEANSNWDVTMYDYPTRVFQKTGSSIIISGSLNTSGSVTIASGSGDLYMYGHKMFSIGQFQNNSTLSGSANVSQSMTFDTTDYSEGVSLVAGSRLTVANSGYYNIQFSAQIKQTGGGTANAYVWFKRNGSNVSESATRYTLPNNTYQVAALNLGLFMSASDYVEIAWQSDDASTQLLWEAPTGNIPAVPSVIATVTQIR